MSGINYKQDFFEYDPLTKVIGEPNFASLLRLKNELKANSQTVSTQLGGGQHGFLGAVLSPAEYALISNTPFEPPTHPGQLNIPTGTTQVQSKNLEMLHTQRVKDFDTYTGVTKALIQQIVQAVPRPYLAALRNDQTNYINVNIPGILDHLFKHYGDVSSESLLLREEEVRALPFNPASEPVDTIFDRLQRLQEFASAASSPYSQAQIINIAYVILLRTRRFGHSITEWNRLITANANHRSWANFKNHFRVAQRELRERADLTAVDTNFNSANLIQEITDRVTTSIMANLRDDAQDDIGNVPPPTNENANAMVEQPANATDFATMLQQVLQLQSQTMLAMNNQLTGNNTTGGGRNSNRGRRNNSNNNRGENRTNTNKNENKGATNNKNRATPAYCWTHGWCLHSGESCRNKAAGHKDEATVDNRLGGSTFGLPPGYT